MKPTLELIAVIASLVTFAGGLLAWWSANVQKSYAAQRDFEHLKRNYQQLAINLEALEKANGERHHETMRELDQRFDTQMIQLKTLENLINRWPPRGGLNTDTGWHHSKE